MPTITKPTLLLDTRRAERNIRRMSEKAARLRLRFRPHFKTHQSAAVGRMFRACGVEAITVSSVDMAEYFAADGWRDILIAFPVNVLEIDGLRRLARTCRLGLLIESETTVAQLRERLGAPADIWIKIDSGLQRAGIAWDDEELVESVARAAAAAAPGLTLRGLLTHNGLAYGARSLAALAAVHAEGLERLRRLRAFLEGRGIGGLEISVGDTPSCSRLEDFASVDEIRPGNFVLYDAMQLELETCREEDIAAAVACPVVAVHKARNRAVLFGGAVHLSKESFVARDGKEIYGRICRWEGEGWGAALPGTFVSMISQEHGIVTTTPEVAADLEIGDILVVLPVHSCLTVNLWPEYRTLEGRPVRTMRGELS